MSRTKIPWADSGHSINPLRASISARGFDPRRMGWHCTKISAGCKNCYAEKQNLRFGNGAPYDNRKVEWEVDLSCFYTLPKRSSGIVFLQSMSDLFHEDVSVEMVAAIYSRVVNALNDKLRFVLLTKRPHRIAAVMDEVFQRFCGVGKTYSDNLWLGVSVEDQQTADERIPVLLQIPAAKRIISYEPALGEVHLDHLECWQCRGGDVDKTCTGFVNVLKYDPKMIDWVIAGCESGSRRRPADINWFRSVRDQCRGTGVSYFLKQLEIDGKVVHMPKLDGVVWDERPEGRRKTNYGAIESNLPDVISETLRL